MGDRQYAFDANLLLSDGAAAYNVDGVTQVAGAAGVLDLGGPGVGTGSILATTDAPRFEGVAVITLSQVTVSAGNAVRLTLQGCNDPAFPTGTCENLASMDFGNTSGRDGFASSAKTTGTPVGSAPFFTAPAGLLFELPFCNQQGNVCYRYLRMWVDVIASGTITFSAFVTPVSW